MMNELFRTLPKLFRETGQHEQFREGLVFAAWRKIAGERLREQTEPVQLQQKHLIVAVNNEMWKRHLEQLSGEMIFKLNSALGQVAVTFIEFQVDEQKVKDAGNNPAQKEIDSEAQNEIALEQITPQMRKAADAIKDDNLRYQFLLTAGSCLARKERMKNK